jgi:hypothetical protein
MSNSVADFRASSASGQKTDGGQPAIKSEDVRQLAEPLTDLIVRYPGAAIASAFLVGVVIAWWIKRR